LLVASAAACGRPVASPPDAGERAAGRVDGNSGTGPGVGAGDPLAGDALPRHRLWLVNPGGRDAIVFASANAAEVVLDTVPAGDSTVVVVAVRADTLLLRAEAARDSGELLARRSVWLGAGSGVRWVIRDSTAVVARPGSS